MTGFLAYCSVKHSLVLGLQIDAPLDRELELFVCPLEHPDRLAVIHMHEFRADVPSAAW